MNGHENNGNPFEQNGKSFEADVLAMLGSLNANMQSMMEMIAYLKEK